MRASVAANIKKIRKKKGWTQERAAEKAGFHYKYYQHIESGQANLTLASLEKLAKALGIEPKKLMA